MKAGNLNLYRITNRWCRDICFGCYFGKTPLEAYQTFCICAGFSQFKAFHEIDRLPYDIVIERQESSDVWVEPVSGEAP